MNSQRSHKTEKAHQHTYDVDTNQYYLEVDPDLTKDVDLEIPRASARASARTQNSMSSKSRKTTKSKASNPDPENIVRSRGRPIKPHETEPFLAINNLPPEKTFLSEKTTHTPSLAASRASARKSQAHQPVNPLGRFSHGERPFSGHRSPNRGDRPLSGHQSPGNRPLSGHRSPGNRPLSGHRSPGNSSSAGIGSPHFEDPHHTVAQQKTETSQCDPCSPNNLDLDIKNETHDQDINKANFKIEEHQDIPISQKVDQDIVIKEEVLKNFTETSSVHNNLDLSDQRTRPNTADVRLTNGVISPLYKAPSRPSTASGHSNVKVNEKVRKSPSACTSNEPHISEKPLSGSKSNRSLSAPQRPRPSARGQGSGQRSRPSTGSRHGSRFVGLGFRSVLSRTGRITPANTPYLSPNKAVRQANHHIRSPFKHSVDKPDMQPDGRQTPSMGMKERTALAAFHIHKMLGVAGERDAHKTPGLLRKGKLKPLYPVNASGPNIQQCRGIISEARSYQPSPSRTLQRRLQLIGQIPNVHEYLYDRPGTIESVHQTSVASSIDDNYDNNLNSDRNLPDEIIYAENPMAEPPTPQNTFLQGRSQEPTYIHEGTTLETIADYGTDETPRMFATETGKTKSDLLISDKVQQELHITESSDSLKHSTEVLGRNDTTGKGQEINTSDGKNRLGSPSKSVRFAEANAKQDANAQNSKEMKEIVNENIAKQDKTGDDTEKNDVGVEKKNKKNSNQSCQDDAIDELYKKDQDDDDGDEKERDNRNNETNKSNNSGNGGGNQPRTDSCKGTDNKSSGKKEGSNNDSDSHKMQGASNLNERTVSPSLNGVVTADDARRTKQKSEGAKPKVNHESTKGSVGPGSVKGQRSGLADGKRPEKIRRPASAPGQRLANGQRSGSENGQKPGSTNGQRPGSANGQRPAPANGQRPGSANGQRPGSANGQRPALAKGYRPPSAGKERCARFDRSKASKAHTQTLEVSTVLHGSSVSTSLRPESPKCGRSRSASPHNRRSSRAKDLNNMMSMDFFSYGPKFAGHEDVEEEFYTREHKTKVKFMLDGEEEVMETIFIDNNDGDIDLKPGHVIDFDTLETELALMRRDIKTSLKEAEETNADSVNEPVDESNDNDKTGEPEIPTEQVSSEPVASVRDDYSYLLENYRQRCMDRSESFGEFSARLITPSHTVGSLKTRNLSTQDHSDAQDRGSDIVNNKSGGSVTTLTTDSGRGSTENLSEMTQTASSTLTDIPRMDFGESTSDLGLDTARSDLTQGDNFDGGDDGKKNLLELVCDQLAPIEKIQKAKDRKEILKKIMRSHRAPRPEDTANLKVVATTKSLAKNKHGSSGTVVESPPFPPLCFQINARPPAGYLYYFAYGPDMNPDRLSSYLGHDVTSRYWGLLMGFNLVFNKRGTSVEAGGFANLEFNPVRSVEGCLYKITSDDLRILDSRVGYPQHYEHVMLPVWMSNSKEPDSMGVAQYCVPALMYIAQQNWTETDQTLPCDYALSQLLKSSDMLTPAYRESLVTKTTQQPIAVA
ncbi:uncharacterized protein LOC128224758 isoform X2 [Mya arenaria]|uniref:uncharacterized protein LOC128224758 isoform X2 n=1 Tax=Mya arenaria TaxID=6604 RepID=UPI0022E96187|nr:uncharacterized protein LOC128224758 isoform X2 [Mya arenaria]